MRPSAANTLHAAGSRIIHTYLLTTAKPYILSRSTPDMPPHEHQVLDPHPELASKPLGILEIYMYVRVDNEDHQLDSFRAPFYRSTCLPNIRTHI